MKSYATLGGGGGKGGGAPGGAAAGLAGAVAGGRAGISAFFVIPRGAVVGLRRWIEAGIEPIFGKLETFLNDEGGIGVIGNVLLGDAVVLYRVVQHAAEKSDVGAGANLAEQV